MRLIKNIGIGLLVLSAIVFLISLLLPSSVTVSRDIAINAPAKEVYRRISNSNTWRKWYPPLLQNAQVNEAGSIAPSSLQWKSDDGKDYALKILVHDSSLIDVNFFISKEYKPMEARIFLNPEQNGKVTRVHWKTIIPLGWKPWEKFYGMFAEEMIAPSVELSLIDFKAYMESQGDYSTTL